MSSSRSMIRSMLLIAGAQAANILVSLARMKLLALLTGPAGVGVLGIYNSLQSTAATVADLGLGNSGVREIAAAKDDPAVLSRVRRVLFAASLVQGCIATALIWFQRERIANWLFGDTGYATETGMVGIAVLLTLISASQTALLQGLRRISDLGKVTVLSALTGTLAGLFAVWLQGEGGLIWFLIAQPASAVLAAWWFTRRLPGPAYQSWTAGAIWRVWKPMAALGMVFMLAGLVSTMTLLLVRGMVSRDLGLEAAGLFAASWAIAMTYIGFLLSAMGADYYPQLVEVIADRVRANRLMNDQMQLGLALGGPILLALTGLAPWVMALFYSKEFVPAAESAMAVVRQCAETRRLAAQLRPGRRGAIADLPVHRTRLELRVPRLHMDGALHLRAADRRDRLCGGLSRLFNHAALDCRPAEQFPFRTAFGDAARNASDTFRLHAGSGPCRAAYRGRGGDTSCVCDRLCWPAHRFGQDRPRGSVRFTAHRVFRNHPLAHPD